MLVVLYFHVFLGPCHPVPQGTLTTLLRTTGQMGACAHGEVNITYNDFISTHFNTDLNEFSSF